MNSSTSNSEVAAPETASKAGNARAASNRAAADVSSGRYLVLAGVVLALGIAFAWIWSARMKLAFLDPEYAAWSAKQQLVSDCDLGDLLVLGDSRAGAGIMPTRLSMRSANISVGGAKPVELYFFLRRAMACPNMPHTVMLSIDAGHFNSTDTFWERSARFGTFSVADLREIEQVARVTGDRSLFTEHRSDGFPSFLRDWLYAHSFPTLNFASMVRGGLFLRYHNNLAERRLTLLARGQHLFGNADRDDEVAEEASKVRFQALPLERYYFEQMLREMQARGITVEYVVTPINQATALRTSAALRDSFRAFLDDAARRYPNFHVLIAPIPSLPDRFFGDRFSHLNQSGAERFTATVNQALRQAAQSGGGLTGLTGGVSK